MFYVISYDIRDDRRRARLARALLDFGGVRVQYSVFECWLKPRLLGELRVRVAGLVDEEEDSVRFYRLCQSCVDEVEIVGAGYVLEDVDLYIV